MKIGDLIKRVMESRPARVYFHFGQSRGPVLAAGMAYQAIFAIFAALWLVFSVAGLWLAGNPALMDQLFVIINQSVPGLIGKNGVIDPDTLASTGALTWASAIALVGLLVTTLGWLSTTSQAVRGIFAAQQIKPQAKVLAAARGITCVEVDYDALRGIESDVLSLF